MTLDVAHPPPAAGDLEVVLNEAASEVRNSPSKRVLKVIHGYGSGGKGGTIREEVRNWAYRNRSRFLLILPGEVYTMLHPDVQRIRKETGPYLDSDLTTPNPGVTVLWIK